MKLISKAIAVAGFASLAACGGGAANNTAAANNVVEAPLPPEEPANLGAPLNEAPLPPLDSNTTNSTATNTTGNAL